jgi:hypothetical protein
MQRIDYSRFAEGHAPEDKLSSSLARRWWKATDDEAVESVSAILDQLQRKQSARIMQHVIGSRLYGNRSLLSVSGVDLHRIPGSAHKERISYNVVQSALDTVTAKIGKNKTRPLFLPSGGDYRIQRKAKGLNRFVEGVFYENRAYDLGPLVFRDGGVLGDGIVHVFAENKRVKWERALSSELWVDELEAFYGCPRTMHRTKNVDREVLLEMVAGFDDAKKLREAVLAAPRARLDEGQQNDSISDLVNVRESWHLPSGPDADDGQRMLSIQNAVLWRGEYKNDFFPFARFTWSPRLYGYWGQGLAEQIQNLQLEINKLMQLVQRSFHLAGTYKVLLENGSKIVAEHISNEVGALIYYSGVKPEYVVPSIVPPEIFQHLLTLKAAAFEQAGISMLSSVAQKPAGLNSGKALREYQDIESDRFQTIGHSYDTFFLDLARISVAVAKEIGGSYSVKSASRRTAQIVKWSDVRLDEDDYVLQCYPVSSLPREPAGRLQTVQEYMQAGFLSPRQGKRLLDFPDLEQVETLGNAQEEFLEQVLEKIVDEGILTQPEPYDDLKMAREMALQHYAWGKSQGLEEERLDLLRRYLSKIDEIEQAANPPQVPGPGGGVPQAKPEQMPTSNLIQNVPGIQSAAA